MSSLGRSENESRLPGMIDQCRVEIFRDYSNLGDGSTQRSILLGLLSLIDAAISQIRLDESPSRRHMEGVKTLNTSPEFLTVSDVGELLLVSQKTVRRWREEGKLPPALQIGGIIRWRSSEFSDWIEEQVA